MKTEDLTGAVLANQIALNYNEKLKYTKFYKQNLKKVLNIANIELVKIEEREFDLVYDVDSETTHNVSTTLTLHLDSIISKGFANHIQIANFELAMQKDPKRLEGIINKILNK